MSGKSNWVQGVIQLVFVVVVIAFALILSNALKPERNATAAPDRRQAVGPVVRLVQPQELTYQPTIDLTGIVEARAVTTLVPQVTGRVIRVSDDYKPGAQVKRGAVLFEIDPTDFQLAVEQSNANIQLARSDLALLEAEAASAIRDWNELYPGKEISDLAANKPQISAAMARLSSAVAARKTAELALSRTVLRAPFDARVLETRLDIGQVVSPATNVGALYALDSLEISASIPAGELRKLGNVIGRDVDITSQLTPDEGHQGRVARLGAALNERTRLGALYIEPVLSQKLVAGEFVSVSIKGARIDEAWRLPATTLTSLDQLWVVENESLSARRIEILGREDGFIIVSRFDRADGVVAIPPSNALEGLNIRVETARAPSGLRSGASANDG